MANKRPKVSISKYNMGSYVSYSQQPAFTGTKPNSGEGVSNTLSSAASMAASGLAVGGPWGAAIGGIVGLGMGIFGANRQKRAYNKALSKHNKQLHNNFAEEYDSMVDIDNENPYGTYKDGGDIMNNKINIEKGEIQVDPQTGKILRKFDGINPETGGKYEPHSKKGKDTKNNLVTAEEGTFIITKKKAKEYEDAIKNNDKLHQNSIMHNIRNKKRQSFKFADGGDVMSKMINLNGFLIPKNMINNPQSKFNLGKIGGTALDLAPAIANITQGLSTPTQLPTMVTPINRERRNILVNMPREIDMNPLLNRLYRDRNTAYSQIDNTTSSNAIARANKLSVNSNVNSAIQDTYFNAANANNAIRAQRSSIFNQLGEADRAAYINTFNTNSNIALNNLNIREGRRQQFNYGLGQLSQLRQNTINNRNLRNRDLLSLGLIGATNPAVVPYLRQLGFEV